MEATRVRFGAIVEWAVAAAAIVAVVALASFADREVRTVSAVTPVIAREVAAAGRRHRRPPFLRVPSRVPMLLLE